MTQERDGFETWLDGATPTEAERCVAADAAWAQRRRAPVVGVLIAVAAAVALGVWWQQTLPRSRRTPEYGSSLVMRVAGEATEVRIEVGVRKEESE